MTSAINPNNIDGAYPVAGQDNDSQGFRDNFTNTKTNFQYAAEEITNLQNNVLLKAALTGQPLDNDMGGNPLVNAKLRSVIEFLSPLGSQSGTVTLSFGLGPDFSLTTAGPVSLALTGFPAIGTTGRIRLQITVTNTSYTLTFPASVTNGGAVITDTTGIQGLLANTTPGPILVSSTLTFAETGTYEFEIETSDGGSNFTLYDLSRPLSRYTNPISLTGYEDLANAATIDITVTTSYFTTAGPETATLPDAPFGMVKVLYARDVTAGNMVVTLSGTSAWGGAGTITFANTGDACTLLSTGGGWVCIGNNGAVFA